ncbi:nuclear transport factor 2 family protein, partial [Klebsiella pneumoniae]|nr:nuclear transport factor 2 family protein [Klebsiella pneumoniae]
MSCRKALDQYIKATNTHVFANVKELLDRDAVYWFSDQTCSGFEEIQRYFENAWKQIEAKYTAP